MLTVSLHGFPEGRSLEGLRAAGLVASIDGAARVALTGSPDAVRGVLDQFEGLKATALGLLSGLARGAAADARREPESEAAWQALGLALAEAKVSDLFRFATPARDDGVATFEAPGPAGAFILQSSGVALAAGAAMFRARVALSEVEERTAAREAERRAIQQLQEERDRGDAPPPAP